MAIELQKLNNSRKSFIEIEVFNTDGTITTERLDFSYKPISPLVFRQVFKIRQEVEKFNRDSAKKEEQNSFENRSVLVEQLAYLLDEIDIVKNGEPLNISIPNLENINLSILESINNKIFEERFPTKKNMKTSSNTTSGGDESEENLVG